MTILDNKWVLIRKPHKCWGCATSIPKKTEMFKITSVDGREFFTTYWCNICKAFLNTMEDTEDGFEFGAFKGEFEYQEFVKNYVN